MERDGDKNEEGLFQSGSEDPCLRLSLLVRVTVCVCECVRAFPWLLGSVLGCVSKCDSWRTWRCRPVIARVQASSASNSEPGRSWRQGERGE